MTPFSLFRRLYKPNFPLFYALLVLIVLFITYMYLYNSHAIGDQGRDMINYVFVLVFLFLLINVPNDIKKVFIVVGALFALVSNIALVYSLIIDPTWTIGQRAAIQFGEGEARTGNPHVFARNAVIGLFCSLIWVNRPRTAFIYKGFALVSVIFNIAILVLTFSKATILATFICLFLYIAAHTNPTSIRSFVNYLFRPSMLFVALIPILALNFFIYKYPTIWNVLQTYAFSIVDRFGENIVALMGDSLSSGQRAKLDESSANRVVSVNFFSMALVGEPYKLLLGYGYKYTYLDVPVLEAFICQGIVGFILFSYIVLKLLWESLKIIFSSGNELETFLAYLYVATFIGYFTGGRPYEISILHPLCLFIRFLGIYFPKPFELSVPERPVLAVVHE